MKMPGFLGSIMPKKSKHAEVYVSLYLDVHSVVASFWSLPESGKPLMMGSVFQNDITDSWKARAEAVDLLVGQLEEKTGVTDVTKTILGLPYGYLSPQGEIRKDVQASIKEFMKALELKPVGFVPAHQAIIFKIHKDEGVPPSVILMGVSDKNISLSLYKIGVLAGIREIDKTDSIAQSIEQGLKSFTDLEVLPARILLFGSNEGLLEEIQSELLRHSWTSKVNFLHFPKIGILSGTAIIDAVSTAGASELGHTVMSDTSADKIGDATEATVQAEGNPDISETPEEEEPESEEETDDIPAQAKEPDEPEQEKPVIKEDKITEDALEAQKTISEDFAVDSEDHADANVVMVDAESLGFKKDVDILEEEYQSDGTMEQTSEENDEDGLPDAGKNKFPGLIPSVDVSKIMQHIKRFFLPQSDRKFKPFILVAVIAVILIGLGMYYLLPHASVTILEIPKTLEASEDIIIDPSATSVDGQKKIIPGRTREKSVSGDKTVAVTGKKSIGDPAKGTVTVYNKSPDSSLSVKKGTIMSTGTLQFILDSDLDIASAAASIDSVTYAKQNVNVTAVAIGTQSNIPSGNQFTLKNIPSDTAVARNDSAFTGGSSSEVPVVTRADYDAFIKDMTVELTEKAKADFSSTITGGETIIDGTLKTSVTEKVFGQEIDQEVSQLQGKVTLSVSGVAYSDNDVKALLTTIVSNLLPAGYALNDSNTNISVTGIQIRKDGKITAKASMSSIGLPVLDTKQIQKVLSGKQVNKAEEYLRSIPGIFGMEYKLRFSPTKNTLPINFNNISVTVAVAQ
jgi:hypothetical protein